MGSTTGLMTLNALPVGTCGCRVEAVGHQEHLQRPRPLGQLVPTQAQQPGAVGDSGRDLDQTTRPAVHQVGGHAAQAVAGTPLQCEEEEEEAAGASQRASCVRTGSLRSYLLPTKTT